MNEWISVKDRLPEPETEVIILADRRGDKVITTAMYEDGSISDEDSKWIWYEIDIDYDIENDKYLIPEGWWEYKHYLDDDVYNNAVDDTVTHWMPLPEPPKEEIEMISAKEARERSMCKANLITSVEMAKIEELIQNAIEDCEYKISQDGVLSPICRNQLENLGYKVETGTQYNEPWYCIRW